MDGHVPSHPALRLLRREDPKWLNVEVRSCRYLNNIVEQDHRAIKRRYASMAGFKSFDNATITIAGKDRCAVDAETPRGPYFLIGSARALFPRKPARRGSRPTPAIIPR